MPELRLLPTEIAWGNKAEENRVAQYVMERVEAARDWADPFKQSAIKDFQDFTCYCRGLEGFNFRACDPATQDAVKSTIAEVNVGPFAKERDFDLIPLDGQDPVRVEKMREKIVAANRATRMKLKRFRQGADAIKFGVGSIVTLACPFWRKETVEQPVFDPDGYGIQTGTQSVTRDTFDVRPEAINVSYWNRLTYPYAGFPDTQEMPYDSFWLDLPLSTVRAMASQPWAMWQNTDKVVGQIEVDYGNRGVSMGEYDYEFASQRLSLAGWRLNTGASEGPNCVRHCRVYFYYEAPPGGRGCRAWAAVCENHLLVCRGNDYAHALKPITDVKWVPIDETNLWYCLGVPGLCRPYLERLNLTGAQKYELRQKVLTPTRLAWKGFAETDLSKLLAPTGSILSLDSGDATRLTTLDEPGAGSFPMFNDEAELRAGIARATRQTDVSMGTQDPGETTNLKAFASLQYLGNQAKAATAFQLLYFDEEGVVPQIEQMAALLQQLAPEEEQVPLREPNEVLSRAGIRDRMLVTRRDLAGRFEFRAIGASKTLEGPMMAQVIMSIAEKFAADRDVGPMQDKMEIARRIVEMALGQGAGWWWLTQAERARKAQESPPPLPMRLTGSLKDMDPASKAAALQRLGLPGQPEPSGHDTALAVEGEKTRREAVKAMLKPRVVPRREMVGV